MLTAIYFFLGIGGFLVFASLCLSKEKPPATDDSIMNWSKRPTWPKEAKWQEIKELWTEWYTQCKEMEAPRQKSMLSWGSTMALCAALCLVGIVLNAELDEKESASRFWLGFIYSHSAAAKTSQLKPSLSKSIPAASQSLQK